MARWLDLHVLETVATNGEVVVGRGTFEVSADGTTLTISAREPGMNADGWQTNVEQVIVLDRV